MIAFNNKFTVSNNLSHKKKLKKNKKAQLELVYTIFIDSAPISGIYDLFSQSTIYLHNHHKNSILSLYLTSYNYTINVDGNLIITINMEGYNKSKIELKNCDIILENICTLGISSPALGGP